MSMQLQPQQQQVTVAVCLLQSVQSLLTLYKYEDQLSSFLGIYTVSSKKRGMDLFTITSSTVNRL